MAERGTIFLMYHELAQTGRALCNSEPGYTRYVVPASEFRTQMETLAQQGWRGKNVTQAMQSFDGKSVCVTFDDGSESDLLFAAPALKQVGFSATFYITADFVGRPCYLSESQLRDLSSLGFEIGCHSLTHPYLTDIDANRLHEETKGAKDRLEQVIGVAVDHFSCPGGRWNQRVVDAVKAAGFKTMATSRTGLNFPGTDLFALARFAVLNSGTTDKLMRACRGQSLFQTQFQELARDTIKSVLGNSIYDSLRALMLGRKHKSSSEIDSQ
jgi:peptidoglycan/xylan/chitin deacetylase (PgdA/CDA1 family)